MGKTLVISSLVCISVLLRCMNFFVIIYSSNIPSALILFHKYLSLFIDTGTMLCIWRQIYTADTMVYSIPHEIYALLGFVLHR